MSEPSAPGTANGDPPERADHQEQHASRHGWHVSVARLLGRVARWTADEAGAIESLALDPITSGEIRDARFDDESIGALIAQLTELVKRRGVGGHESLQRDTEFWSLVERLHACHRAVDAGLSPVVIEEDGSDSTPETDEPETGSEK